MDEQLNAKKLEVPIRAWEDCVEVDPYRADTGGRTHPHLVLRPVRPGDGLYLEQIRSGDGTPMAEWDGRWIVIDLGDDPGPDPKELREYLESDGAQALLLDAVNGYEGVNWANKGIWNNGGREAIWGLESDIAQLPRDGRVFVDAREGFGGFEAEYIRRNANISAAATDFDGDCEGQGWTLIDDAESYLEKWADANRQWIDAGKPEVAVEVLPDHGNGGVIYRVNTPSQDGCWQHGTLEEAEAYAEQIVADSAA